MKRAGQELAEQLGSMGAEGIIAARMLDYRGAAARLGIKVGTLRSMVSRRQIVHVRLSSRLVLFSAADLDSYLSAHRVQVASEKSSAEPAAGLRVVGGGQ